MVRPVYMAVPTLKNLNLSISDQFTMVLAFGLLDVPLIVMIGHLRKQISQEGDYGLTFEQAGTTNDVQPQEVETETMTHHGGEGAT